VFAALATAWGTARGIAPGIGQRAAEDRCGHGYDQTKLHKIEQLLRPFM
jgi:hypothetical protein